MSLHRIFRHALAIALAVALVASLAAPAMAKPAAGKDNVKSGKVKNVIVMISDGMGYSQMEAADYYLYGTNKSSFANMPFKTSMSTYAHGGSYDPSVAWDTFDYFKMGATDSAAAATAMSCGEKTYSGAIGMDINQQPIMHAMEKAEMDGKATGVVSSVEWSHATPAAYVAHNVSRNNYAEIGTEMIMDSAVDVVMGCGNPWFDRDGNPVASPNTFKYVGGESTWNALEAGTAGGDADGDGDDDPFTHIQTREEFQALMDGETPDRVCGTAQVYQTLQQGRGSDPSSPYGGGGYAPPYEDPMIATVPTLEEMTTGALNVLDNDEDGFVLMVEGGAVDWAGHANQSGRVIEEQIDFVNSVKAVEQWVNENSNWGETLLVVTGDHETGYLTGPGSGQFAGGPIWTPVVNNGQFVQPGMQWNSGSHTNQLIPFFAKGSSARLLKGYADETDPVHGSYLDNTELADVCFSVLD
jgi:alkaline phosphatase